MQIKYSVKCFSFIYLSITFPELAGNYRLIQFCTRREFLASSIPITVSQHHFCQPPKQQCHFSEFVHHCFLLGLFAIPSANHIVVSHRLSKQKRRVKFQCQRSSSLFIHGEKKRVQNRVKSRKNKDLLVVHSVPLIWNYWIAHNGMGKKIEIENISLSAFTPFLATRSHFQSYIITIVVLFALLHVDSLFNSVFERGDK